MAKKAVKSTKVNGVSISNIDNGFLVAIHYYGGDVPNSRYEQHYTSNAAELVRWIANAYDVKIEVI
jgi:hypothetical protein